ncbi:Outer membrane porin F precursor [Marinomonas gallaica]|uniref:Outer membrane porin F n=1 Tax=Marinomonas gallaica TaxID=1806667 RepID=A0A1C3JP80_9GAMM|nr:OmpA family protein [Marinomonas gallaica]SBT16925.1 Outer membrane porin F precursor [Marinomonas gallaica]SBT22124.1 Outer membrane porin F precursor [Marinomonas gallaica]
MSNIFKKTAILSGILAASATAVHAEEPVAGFTLTPSIGYSAPDNNRGLDDDRAFGLSFGYQFDNPWGVEFTYLNLDSELSNGQNIDADQYRLDGLYNFFNSSSVTPYLAAGLGATHYGKDLHGDENTQLNAGAGLKFALSDNTSLRADYRVVEDLQADHTDQVATIGLQYSFGAKKAAPAPAPIVEPTPVVEVTPVVEPEPAPPVKTVLPYDIHFAFDSAHVAQSEYSDLQNIADHLEANPEQVAQIRGFADSMGPKEYNETLSVKRADAVAKRLVEDFGVDASRLDTVGYGEAYPVVENTSKANRQLNRRTTTVSFSSREAMENDMPN